MKSLKESIETHRKLLVILIALSLGLVTFILWFYFDQAGENRALKIKILSMSENKKIAKPWNDLIQSSSKIGNASEPKEQLENQDAKLDLLSLADLDMQALASKLNIQLADPKNLDLATLEQNIEIADEIISREPDSYHAYKGKLISLLVKEGKFKAAVDEEELESLLEMMAQFKLESADYQRNVSLISAESKQLESQLIDINQRREELESSLNSLEKDSLERRVLNDDLEELRIRESILINNINSIESSGDLMVDSEVIEIPFKRMLAQNDYEGVIDDTQEFIQEFPNSPSAYFYLIRALELKGQKEEAMSILENSNLSGENYKLLIQRLKNEGSDAPENYWEQLKF